MALVGTRFTFCLAEHAGNSYCFTADLEAKTIAPASAPPDASSDHRQRVFWEGNGENPTGASLAPSLRGKGLTACTHDKATCHELPIDAASAGDKPVAVSDDATLVAIDTRDPSPDGKGWLEIWDAVAGKQLASFEIRYGPTTAGYETPHRKLVFLGHTVVAFTESACALPCSSATMYSTRGKYLGMLATDPTAATAEHFHDELYLLRTQGPDRSFVVQDAATGKSTQMDPDTNASWDAVVTPDRIVRVVGAAQRSPQVEIWGRELQRATVMAVPVCRVGPPGSGSP